jgi:pyruvate/2-oxoglutarate dehydrogenase complex dihydrolipoamide dehydrogenase (E3) component
MREAHVETTVCGEVFPKDEHNKTLVANVHPLRWTNPEPAPRYNLVVIGAGTAGLVTAAGAAGLGAKVALIERNLLGGDCLNVGCVPSKCIIASSRIVGRMHAAAEFGVRASTPEIDFGAVMERMRRLRARISHHDSAQRFQSELGVDVFLGHARFTGPDRIEVDGKTLRFKRAVVATGARPTHPPIAGLAEAGFLTNETVFSLTERPPRLAVLGGGPIGCELAQAFRRLGSTVTIIEMGSQFLPREDQDAAVLLTAAFKRDGVDVRLNTRLKSVEVSGLQKLLHLERGSTQETLAVDEILVAVGRTPNVEGLDLEAAGVQYTTKGVAVNNYLQTSNPNIYAAGDVCLPYKFTHTADATARIVIQNALFLGRKKLGCAPRLFGGPLPLVAGGCSSHAPLTTCWFEPSSKHLSALTIPWCTYTDPEIAHVGITVQDAEIRGIALDTFLIPLRDIDRAIADGQEDGFVKIHVKKGTDRILGATIVASHAGEMISEITLAIVGRIGLGRLAGVIHPYPTQAEAIRKAADAYNRTRLTPAVKKLFERWLRWTR